MTDTWLKLEKCKECGRVPMILPAGKNKKSFYCDHWKQSESTKFYTTPEEWNKAQNDK